MKTVTQIMESTGLTRKDVLEAGKLLADNLVIHQTKVDGETAYEKDSFLARHKNKILTLAGNPVALNRLPTKTNPTPQAAVTVRLELPGKLITVEQITVDEIDSFTRVRGVEKRPQTKPLAEADFKRGMQSVIGEEGTFQDWGGEKNDLLTTRLRLGGRRRTAAIAFKGPGTKGKLTPGKMGKHGDQIQRLFSSPADVFIVQHWNQVDESVLDQMRNFATAKSAVERRPIWFGVIDGQDSQRLRAAYPEEFGGTE